MEKCIGDKGLKVNIEKVKVMVCVSEGLKKRFLKWRSALEIRG